MAVEMQRQLMSALAQLRYQPVLKRVRAGLGDDVVADTRRSVLVWEPMRIVPSYAVPLADVQARLEPAAAGGPAPEYRPVGFGGERPALLDPSVPFAVHTATGEPQDVRTDAAGRPAAAYRLGDEDLDGYVILDFDAF